MKIVEIIVALGALFVGWMVKIAFENRLLYQTVHTAHPAIQTPISFLFISDIHRRTIQKRLFHSLIEPLQFIIIGGDLCEKGVPLERIRYNLKLLRSKAPVYYIWGNNDREVGEENLRKLFEEENVEIIENGIKHLSFDHTQLSLVAIDDMTAGKANIAKSFEQVNEQEYTIFVSHSPFVFDKIVAKYAPDILLAGHTHGGQIRFLKWGMYEKGTFLETTHDSRLISNGYGTSLVPLRLGARPEVHVIAIQQAES